MAKHPRINYNGFINLNKPLGISSADAVFQVKRLIHPSKIGHAGTLDPLATGVLPLALGEGTKCINLLMDAKKTYEFTITFGERRSTDDAEGEVVATSANIPAEAEIQTILPRFTGEISQVPPAYSAIKIDGQRAYALARAGEEVEMKPRQVVIYSLEFLGFAEESLAPAPPLRGSQNPLGDFGGGITSVAESPHQIAEGAILLPLKGVASASGKALPKAHFRATVSKGTYIRSLGRDIAQAVGAEGYISRLHRSAVGPFTDAAAISLDFLEKSVHKAAPSGQAPWLMPLTTALDDIPALAVNGRQLSTLRHGQQVLLPPCPDAPLVGVLHEGQLVGLARVEGNRLITIRLLNV